MFLELLKMHIEEKGYKFSQIAKSLNKSVSYVNEIHKGRREIRPDDLIKFSDALELSFEEKTEFIEVYLSEKYPDLFSFLRLNISGVESVPVLETKAILSKDFKEIESSTHIPVVHSKIKGILSIKLERTILEEKFQKGDYIVIKLKENKKINDEDLNKYILCSDIDKVYIDQLTLKEGKYFFMEKEEEVSEKIEIIGYIIGKYTNIS